MRRLLQQTSLQRGLPPFNGGLVLGCAREILLTPASQAQKRESEFSTLSRLFSVTLDWRFDKVDPASIRRDGLPPSLVENPCQSRAQFYGLSAGGLPVVVDQGSQWFAAINECRRLGMSPSDFAMTRVYWHERCCETAAKYHQQGRGNGQFIHVIDFGDLAGLSFNTLYNQFPYIKTSIVDISLNYGGTARRIYIARPPKIFHIGYTMLKPFLPDKTKYKILVLPARNPQKLEDYGIAAGNDPLCKMAPDSLPPLLGGTVEAPLEPMYDIGPSRAPPVQF